MIGPDSQSDPEIGPFLTDCDATFDPAFDRLALADQRAVYDLFWRRFDAPRPEGIRVEEVLVPTPEGGCRALLYRPKQAITPVPVAVYFHGGGWMFGSPESHDLITARLCRQAAVAVLSLDYRLSPEHRYPAALMDCLAAVRWLSEKGRGLGLLPDRMALAGDSAGANLAAALAMWLRDKSDVKIFLQALVYPVLSCVNSSGDGAGTGGISSESMRVYLSSYFGARDHCSDPYAMPLSAKFFTRLPPAFIATAGLDPLRPDGEAYAEALQKAGIPVEYHCAAGLPHTYLRAIHVCRAAAEEFAAMSRAINRALVSA